MKGIFGEPETEKAAEAQTDRLFFGMKDTYFDLPRLV